MTCKHCDIRLRTPKGFSCKVNRRRTKNEIADMYEEQSGKLHAAKLRIKKQSLMIEKLLEKKMSGL